MAAASLRCPCPGVTHTGAGASWIQYEQPGQFPACSHTGYMQPLLLKPANYIHQRRFFQHSILLRGTFLFLFLS